MSDQTPSSSRSQPQPPPPTAPVQPPAPTQPPDESVSFSPEALHILLIAAMEAVTSQPVPGTTPLNTPANRLVPAPLQPPPFVAAASAYPPDTDMSLFDRFPQIESSTILEIARHEFRPMDLYKLDPSAIQPRAGSLRDYPTFASLFEPLLMYFSVLATYAATSGGDAGATLAIARGGYTYSAHLSKLNRRFRWPAVLQYHTAFFLNRRREMVHGDYSGWLRSDTELMNEHLFGHGRAPPTRRYVHVVFK